MSGYCCEVVRFILHGQGSSSCCLALTVQAILVSWGEFIMGFYDLEEDQIYRSDLNFDGEINLFDLLHIVDAVAN